MGISEERAERIRAIELIRVRAYFDVREERMAAERAEQAENISTYFRDGPPGGSCDHCERPVKSRWLHCTFCGQPTAHTCIWCHERLPAEEAHYCPRCGKSTSR